MITIPRNALILILKMAGVASLFVGTLVVFVLSVRATQGVDAIWIRIDLREKSPQDNPQDSLCTISVEKDGVLLSESIKPVRWSQLPGALESIFKQAGPASIYVEYWDSKHESIDDAKFEELKKFVSKRKISIHRYEASAFPL